MDKSVKPFDFKDTDIQKLTVTIEMLKYIAPNLKITFATDEENVTLPIHKVFCSEYVNKLIQCENVGGWYFPDFIYSDLKPRCTKLLEAGLSAEII